MSIIQKQTIKGSIYAYIGVMLGFIIRGIIFPKILTTEENGLLSLLVSLSVVFAHLASLGFNSVIIRLFAYFRDYSSKQNGFVFILLTISIIGFILSALLLIILKSFIYKVYSDNSMLFLEYFNTLFILIFFTLFFGAFDAYNRVLYNATLGIFIKEVLLRIFVLLSVGLFYFKFINLKSFIYLYIISLCLQSVVLLIYLIYKKQFSLKPKLNFIGKELRQSMIYVSFFGIIGGFANIVILNIDGIFVSSLLDLSANGIYTITFFFGTLVLIPSRALINISSTIIADKWKENNIKDINAIYYKSCLNQLIIAAFIFACLWINIHNILEYLPPEYSEGKYVIFFIGLANVIDMLTGVNGSIIALSKYYRYQAYFAFILLMLVVITNYIFIKKFGLVGAAFASFLSKFIYNLMRYLFLYFKYNMQPLDLQFVKVIIISVFSFLCIKIIPVVNNLYIDILIRTSLFSALFWFMIYFFKPSIDIENKINEIRLFLFKK